MVTKEDILTVPRSKIRYKLYRIRTWYQSKGDRPHDADNIKEYYESLPEFTNWETFAERWDVGAEGNHATIVKREIGEQAEWRARLENLIPEAPVKIERVENDPWPPLPKKLD